MFGFLKRWFSNNRHSRASRRLVVDPNGFRVVWSGGFPSEIIVWENVVEIQVFKVDLVTSDDIRLTFLVGETHCEISESWEGFSDVTQEMHRRYPSIAEDWHSNAIHPAFATKQKTLWKRRE